MIAFPSLFTAISWWTLFLFSLLFSIIQLRSKLTHTHTLWRKRSINGSTISQNPDWMHKRKNIFSWRFPRPIFIYIIIIINFGDVFIRNYVTSSIKPLHLSPCGPLSISFSFNNTHTHRPQWIPPSFNRHFLHRLDVTRRTLRSCRMCLVNTHHSSFYFFLHYYYHDY